MADLNKVFLMGNLTRDPEVKYTPKGTAVGDIGIAVNDSYKAQDGTIKEVVTFINVEVWGRQAETCKQYLSKGRPVFIEGRLQLDQWEKDGVKQSRMKVKADRVQFLGGGGGGRSGSGAGGGESRPAPAAERPARPAPASEEAPPMPDEDDIPF